MPYKLGKDRPKFHPKTLMFSKYLLPDAPPPPPAKTYYEYKIPPDTIGMYGNDLLSDCLAAYAAHHLMLLTAHAGTLLVPDPDDVIAFYSKFSGYVQGDPSTDNGGTFVDMYNVWQTEGLCGHKILGWAAIDPNNALHRQQANYLFGGLGVGVQLPASAQSQFSAGQPWTLVPGDTVEGGHAILQSGEGSLGRNFGTWGKGDQKATDAWGTSSVDEQYAVITTDWIEKVSGESPTSLNLDALNADLNALKV